MIVIVNIQKTRSRFDGENNGQNLLTKGIIAEKKINTIQYMMS